MKKIILGFKALFGFPIYIYKINKKLNKLEKSIEQIKNTQSNSIKEIKNTQSNSIKEIKNYLNYKTNEIKYSNYKKKSLAIMTVFILRENILFLEEWIEHHIRMGVDHFFLYDNSKAQVPAPFDRKMASDIIVLGKINKYNVDYTKLISEDDAIKKLNNILEKYKDKITLLDWSKKDEEGNISYFQEDAIRDFTTNNLGIFEYGLHIDIDEFMVSRKNLNLKDIIEMMEDKNITSYYFAQRQFESRFLNLDKKVLEINRSLPHDRMEAYKTLFKLTATNFNSFNSLHLIETFNNVYLDPHYMLFHHYNYSHGRAIKRDNLSEKEAKERLDKELIINEDALKYLDKT